MLAIVTVRTGPVAEAWRVPPPSWKAASAPTTTRARTAIRIVLRDTFSFLRLRASGGAPPECPRDHPTRQDFRPPALPPRRSRPAAADRPRRGHRLDWE